jgi:predicted TIM-barrel enzyme
MMRLSPRVQYWREKRRRGASLFAAACASAAEAKGSLPLAPDLILYHPAFPSQPAAGETGMLSALQASGNANEAAASGMPPLPELCAPCPVAMGVCGTDPFLLRVPAFAAWSAAGLEGIANFPTIGLADGFFRADLEASGLGMARELACLREAHAGGFCTVGLACRPEDAAAMAEAGCDALIVHLGLTAEHMPRPLASARKDAWPAYLGALRGKGEVEPLLFLHGEHLTQPADEAAWKGMFLEGCDGLFAAGGPTRIKALRALAPA